jgi:phosphoribosyl-ATP pyrophosphohydrolase
MAESFLYTLEGIIAERLQRPDAGSYTARIAADGKVKAAQKLGEEAVEVALAAVAEDGTRLRSEAADLLYHLLLVLALRGVTLAEVVEELERRHRERKLGPAPSSD